ncbi:MAG: rhodanese-like domain-containing protein [Alphaproteobacteria bacterium]|nr:rhodanese-like domain-containing protein [Alphaproteobacteria bacterium]
MQEITPQETYEHKDRFVLVDVREPYELAGPEGKIEGALLATLGHELIAFLETADSSKEYVFICRRGHRSAQACDLALSTYGFEKIYNMQGGMMAWNEMLRHMK